MLHAFPSTPTSSEHRTLSRRGDALRADVGEPKNVYSFAVCRDLCDCMHIDSGGAPLAAELYMYSTGSRRLHEIANGNGKRE